MLEVHDVHAKYHITLILLIRLLYLMYACQLNISHCKREGKSNEQWENDWIPNPVTNLTLITLIK